MDFNNFEASIGVSVNDTIRENNVAKATVNPNCWKNCPTIPPIKAIGVNTTILVAVAATTAKAISPVPRSAAAEGSSPSCTRRIMFSNTTMEFATRIPTEIANPISDIKLRVNPANSTSVNVAIMEVGIETAAMTVPFQLCKNR